MYIPTFTAPAVLVTGALLLLTACGGAGPLEGKNGSEVADLAADALAESGAVRLSGTITQDGEETQIDMQLQEDDSAGTITLQGTEIELIRVDGDVYVRATGELLASLGAPAEQAADFDGRWIMMPAEDAADFEDFTLDGFVEQLRGPEGAIEEETSEDEVDGESVVVVQHEDGSTLTVADDDPPYPLELSGADEEGTLTFSNHGEEEDISAPDDVISPEELEGN